MGSSESKTIMANDNDLAKDLTGKVIVVTGGNSGIGLQTVAQLTKQNATVVMCCRNLVLPVTLSFIRISIYHTLLGEGQCAR